MVLAIAEQANDGTRRGYPGIELIAHRAGVDAGTVSRTLNRLRKKGTELRVPMAGVGSGSKTIYAVRGHRTVYEIPRLCPLPTHGTKICVSLDGLDGEPEAEERPDHGPGFPSSDDEERADHRPAIPAQRADGGPGYSGERADGGPERADGGPPHPLSSPQSSSPQADGSTNRAPRTGRRDWGVLDDDARQTKEAIEKLAEPLRTIFASLSETDPGVTQDEAQAVLTYIARQAIDANKPIRSVKYYSAIAKDGFSVQLASVRALRLAKASDAQKDAQVTIKEQLAALRKAEPDCEHGTAAGGAPHPVTGEALCPACRLGIPAPREEIRQQKTDGSSRVVDAYRAGWEAAGHEPIEIATLVAIGAEASSAIATGQDIVQLTRIAAHAGEIRNTLSYAARKLSEALR